VLWRQAFAIVRETRSAEGANMIVQYCRANRDFESAIEFMVLAGMLDEAFKVALLLTRSRPGPN
jgi:hypothetical protein